MSKRFGRNQKRAMQAEINEAVSETDALRTTAIRLVTDLDKSDYSREYLGAALREEQNKTRSFEDVARLQDEYRYGIAVVAEALKVVRDICPDSSLLRDARRVPDKTWIVERHEIMTINLSPPGPQSNEPELYDIRRLDLHQLEIELLAADPFREAMEFRVGVVGQNGGQVVAGLRHTSKALIQMGADRIANELAPHVRQFLQERFG